MTRIWSRFAPFGIAGFAIVAAWWAVILVFKPHVSLLPPPTDVATEFWALLQSGALLTHIGASLGRVCSAWVLAALVAIPLGIAMGRIPIVERLLDPLVELIRPISPLAWIPLAILWFGIGESGKVFVVFIGAFFPSLVATIAGVKRIDPVLIQAGQVLGCHDKSSLSRKVVLPAALPNIITGLRISFGTGWAAIIAADSSRRAPASDTSSPTAWRSCAPIACWSA